MDIFTVVVLFIVFMLIFGRIKIPKGLMPVPALEIELPTNYKASISINQREFITIPLEDHLIEDYRRHKKELSKQSRCLKFRTTGDFLINLYDIVDLEDDELTIDIEYSKFKDSNVVQRFGEIDYALAYVHNGKLLHDTDIEEKKFQLEDQGNVTLNFTGLREKVQKRIKRYAKD